MKMEHFTHVLTKKRKLFFFPSIFHHDIGSILAVASTEQVTFNQNLQTITNT